MEEGYPSSETGRMRTSPQEEPTLLESQSDRLDSAGAPRPAGLIIAGFVVVVALVVAGLFLPPISLGQRLGWGGEAAAGETTESIPEETNVTTGNLSIPGEITLSLAEPTSGVDVASVAAADFRNSADDTWAAAATAIPTGRTLSGNVYVVDSDGTAIGQAMLAIPADSDAPEMLDLYGWDGTAWVFVPSQIDPTSQQIVSLEQPLPRAFALMHVTDPSTPSIGAEVLPAQELPAEVLSVLSEVTAGTLTLVDDGELDGEVTAVPDGAYARMLRATNQGAVIDHAALDALLSDTAAQSDQIEALVETAADGGYAGVNLDYQGVTPEQQEAFTGFVANLAEALQAQDLELAVTLATPQNVGSEWDSGGQDWVALGRLAHTVYVQLPLDPTVYGDNGRANQLLNWATRQIDRSKITLLASAYAVDRIGESFLEVANEQALTRLGELKFVEGSAEVEPETPVEVVLAGSATPLEWDGASLTYKYTYDLSGQTHHVWLANAAALGHRLDLANRHYVRGVAVRGLGNVADGAAYAAALESVVSAADMPEAAGAAIVWTVRDEADSVLASESGNELSFAWKAEKEPGEYTIHADFALGDAVEPLGSLTVAVAAAPEPVAREDLGGEEEPAALSEESTAPATNNATEYDPGDADAVVNTTANVRVGPGLAYSTIAGGLTAGARVALIGRNSDSSWLHITMPDGETKGWIFAPLVNVNPALTVSALAVVEVDPPVVPSGDSSGGGTAPSAPPVVAPITNSGFELGGQTHSLANPALMSYAGMNWVKFQHKWGSGDTPNAVAGRIQQAHANGFKVLLSIPGADHSSIDFNAYVNFLGGVAALGPDAIEVWNEQNIDREWPAGQIDPTAYVNNMLAPAYNAIKSANPNVMVISGAPAPTGFYGGCSGGGCDDGLYVAGMAAAGAASYMDCIGIHYNEGIISPNQTSGDPRGGHYTRYFWGMVNTYYNAFGGSRPLCFTELGYLSGVDYGGVPGGFSWAGNTTIAQHAQWLAEAASLSASSGKVRLFIVFNIDFTHYSSDPQAGYAMIRADGSCPACEALRQVTGGR